MILPSGKIDPRILEKHFRDITIFDKRLVIGPRTGEDTAVIENGDTYLLLKTDPITFTADRIGWYSIHINTNDIATMGGIPKFFLATVLLPERKTTKRLIASIMRDLKKALDELRITLCGGHTEVTPGLDRVIIAGTMVGEVPKKKLVRNDRINAGDAIILCRGIAIEGTSIIAREKESDLARHFSGRFLKRAKNFIHNPGISVLQAAQIAAGAAPLTGMHDPTEGGLLGGIWETAYYRKLGFEINPESVPVYPESRKLCEYFNLDPLKLIASGALIISAGQKHVSKIIDALNRCKIPATQIGRYTRKPARYYLIRDDKKISLTLPFVDEITKIL